MSYSVDKKTGEITLYGLEKGIASSPHQGIGDIKGLNISSMPGEVMVNYDRSRQSQNKTITNQLNALTSSTLTALAGSGTTSGLLAGTWIHITSSSIINLTNGSDYYVKSSSGGTITVATSYEGSAVNSLGVTGTATFSVYAMGQPLAWAATSASVFPNYDYFVLDDTGLVWYQRPSSFTTWRLLQPTATSPAQTGIFCFGSYLIGIADKLQWKALNNLGADWQDFGGTVATNVSGSGYSHQALVSHNGTAYWCDGSALGSLAMVSGQSFDPSNTSKYTFTKSALNLPLTDSATVIAEIATGNGTNILTGGVQNVLYPWDGLQTTFGPLIYLPENNTVQLLTVNQLVYVFCGSKGNIYLTNGSSFTSVMTVPDYIANNTGTNQDPYFIWGGAMYLRSRVWFSVKAANCGGIWSFVPTINYYINQDTGASLRLESPNSYATYAGYATVLFPALSPTSQQALGPQYYAGWNDGTAGLNPNGIDYSATTAYTGGSIIEWDLIPIGTLLNKTTNYQLEYKLSAPLAAGESVQFYYRQSLTDSFVSCGSVISESGNPLSGYFTVNFQGLQWLQLKSVLTSTTSSPSWVRMSAVYIR